MNRVIFYVFCLNSFFVYAMESPGQSPNVKIRKFKRTSSDKINEEINKSGGSPMGRGRRQSLDKSDDSDGGLNKSRGGSPIPRVRKQSFGTHPEFVKYNEFAKEENLTIENLKRSSDEKK